LSTTSPTLPVSFAFVTRVEQRRRRRAEGTCDAALLFASRWAAARLYLDSCPHTCRLATCVLHGVLTTYWLLCVQARPCQNSPKHSVGARRQASACRLLLVSSLTSSYPTFQCGVVPAQCGLLQSRLMLHPHPCVVCTCTGGYLSLLRCCQVWTPCCRSSGPAQVPQRASKPPPRPRQPCSRPQHLHLDSAPLRCELLQRARLSQLPCSVPRCPGTKDLSLLDTLSRSTHPDFDFTMCSQGVYARHTTWAMQDRLGAVCSWAAWSRSSSKH